MEQKQVNKFGLTDRDMQTISGIFSNYPEVIEVHIFGSRAKGTFRFGSDVDLAIINDHVSDKTIRQLQSDFEESSLPYRVEIVNYPALNHPEFKDHIQRVGIQFYKKMETQKNNPLHNITLAQIMDYLVENHGWEFLASEININCFKNDPSVKSALTFLRKTPWARTRVENLYLYLKKKAEKKKST